MSILKMLAKTLRPNRRLPCISYAKACSEGKQRCIQYLLSLSAMSGLGVADVSAVTYYVDVGSGNDSNAGTSQSAPWRTIPGTRTANGGNWLRSTWGSVTSSNKLQPGDIIELRAGGTMTSAIGGKLVIDSSYYNNGTSTAPITIRVSPSWGSGNFTYDMSGMTNQQYQGMVEILNRNYIQINGAGSTRRFVVRDAPGDWALIVYGSSSVHAVGHKFSYLEIMNSANAGLDIAYADNWIVANTISHDNGTMGFSVGALDDAMVKNGTFVDSEAYRNGLGQANYAIAHGFGLYGGMNVTYLRCRSHDNKRDGFDFGTATNTHSASAKVINSESYNNGEDGFGVNGGTVGTVSVDYINVIAFNNKVSGWQIYDGPKVGIYHSIAHSNGANPSFGGNILTYTDTGFPRPNITLRNNVLYKPKYFAQIGSYNSPGGTPIISSNYNIYVPRSSNAEIGFDFPWGTNRSYTNPPSFIGPNDKLGTAFDPRFVSASSTTTLALNNYHLAFASGPAINAGITLTSVVGADKDRDGKLRSSPPEIGLYEYGTTASSALAPPMNLRVLP